MGDIIKKGMKYIYKSPCRRIGPLSSTERKLKAFRIRVKAAAFWKARSLIKHPNNGDEAKYPNKIGSYSKALPHNHLGEVKLSAYNKLIRALKIGESSLFESIPLGGVTKLVDPQASYAYELTGPDSHQLRILAPPALSSAAMAVEAVELYWMALTRDVPFSEYETDPLITAACEELSTLSHFSAPKINKQVTPQTIYRENIPGVLIGPFISQFLWKGYPFITNIIEQRYRTAVPNQDFLTDYDDWLAVQNGFPPTSAIIYDPTARYIRSARDLAEWVHVDHPLDGGIIACRILLALGKEALDPANPYLSSATQTGFGTFGPPHILDFVARAPRPALEAAWFHKWLVHRRQRPEEYGGLVQNLMTGAADYPLDPQILNSKVLAHTYKKYGSYLLPQSYPEGSPAHPEYPSGHSAFIGAMVTMLKAYFNESYVLPDPVVPTSDGLSLVAYSGPSLTIGGELNKLACNIGTGRLMGGIHFRSSNLSGIKLGEDIAIGIMRDYKSTYNEFFKGFALTKFDGTTITI
jgi:hypothetical protein